MGWEAVAKDRYLYVRDGVFYVRRRVPKSVVQAFSREHITESLRTSDYREASRLAILKNAEIQRRFDAASGRSEPANDQGLPRLDDLSISQIEESVQDWFRREMQRTDRVSDPFSMEGLDQADETDERDDPQLELRECDQSLARLLRGTEAAIDFELRPVVARFCQDQGIAVRLAKSRGLSSSVPPEIIANRNGSKYKLFRNLVRRRQAALLKFWIAQLTGTERVTDQELPAELRLSDHKHLEAMSLAGLIEEFKSDPNRRVMRKHLELDYEVIFRLMDEVVGQECRLEDISRDDCKAVRELLLRLPPNATKRFPGVSFREAAATAEKQGLKRLSTVTVNSYLHKMSALFNYAVKEDRIKKNPAFSLGLPGHGHTEGDRLPFSLEQLTRIFKSPIYTGCVDDQQNWSRHGPNRPRGTRFWIPVIALLHGMRLNEICQLHIADIEAVDGLPVFHVRSSTSQQRVKTDAGRRIVPFHPFFQRLKFDAYAASIRQAGNDRLFPDLKLDTRGYYSDGFQKWFARLIAHADAGGDRTSFHSFRHNWRDAMREARVPQERVRLIGGWKRTSTDEMYGAGLSAKALQKDIAKVKYPDLDLDHLLPS